MITRESRLTWDSRQIFGPLVYTCMNITSKTNLKHILSFHAKNTRKQGCCCYFIPNLTPQQVWTQTFESALTKTTSFFFFFFFWKWTFSDLWIKKKTPFSRFFLKNSIFRPLNTKRVLRVVIEKKDPLLRVFLFTHVYTYISEWSPGDVTSHIYADALYH